MRRDQLLRAVGLGLVLVAAWIGLTFGVDIARFRRMSAALESLESCATDAECESAWAELRAARGRK